MPLAEHLHPKTYWEERCALAEQAMTEFLRVIATHSSPACARGLSNVMGEWDRLIEELNGRFPPHAAGVQPSDGGQRE